jgi:BirA family transcriptional regulator, biotin operon repressor / biotin---[acetyl-CoA-carboxylase] ligase
LQPAPNRIGSTLIELHQVDSTNNYATSLIHAGMAQHGVVVITKEQTRGKGQRNRSWNSAPEANITLSAVIEPDKPLLPQAFLLSMAVAVGTERFFSRYAGTETTIKWPNDIYWNDRKAGGILIENIISGTKWKFAVAGIGLNINQANFGDLGTKAVSLKQITGKDYDVPLMARELLDWLQLAYVELTNNPEALISEYQKKLYRINEEARFRKGNMNFSAVVKGVSNQGALILQHGVEKTFDVGEVEWII